MSFGLFDQEPDGEGEANPVVNRYLIIEFIIETLVLVVCCAVAVLRIALVSELRVVSNITM